VAAAAQPSTLQVSQSLQTSRTHAHRKLAPAASGLAASKTADEAHNADGKHIGYLTPGHRSAGRLRQLDPDPYERLARLVSTGQRSTAALASAGLLGAQTRFFSDLLGPAGLPASARDARQARRRSWTQRHWPQHRDVT